MGAAVRINVPNPRGPQSYNTIPETVQAIQFLDWSSAQDIFAFTEGFLFVPRGYAHALRHEGEMDRSNNQVLEHAPEFLIMKNEEGQYRLDIGCWVVKDASGLFRVYLNEQFVVKYASSTDMY